MRKFKGIRALLWIMGIRIKKAPSFISDLSISSELIKRLKEDPESWHELISWDEREGCLATESMSVTKSDDKLVVSITNKDKITAYAVLGVASSFYVDLEIKQLLRRRYLHNRTRFDHMFKMLLKQE